jgi:hypothetical protein
MMVVDTRSGQFIFLWHGDSEISLFAFAVDREKTSAWHSRETGTQGKDTGWLIHRA